MKKRNTRWVPLIVLCIAVVSACTDVKKPATQESSEWNNFDRIVKKLKSAEIISNYMTEHIHYTSSTQRVIARRNGYRWKTPQETFNDKYGFCYDLSAFALYCLIANGYSNAKLLFVCWGDWGTSPNTGHFVCMFEKSNQYYSIDNGKLKGPFDSIKQLIESASRKRDIKNYNFFDYNDIPFHRRYKEMKPFCTGKKP